MKERENEEVRKAYKSMLPNGYQKKIAKDLGLQPSSICQFLSGKLNSSRIEVAVLKTIAELKREREKLLKDAGLL